MDDVACNVCKDKDGNFIRQPIMDTNYFNRYYFNYPPEWKTSDTGEQIIGLRSIWIHKKKRKLEFQLCIRKYRKSSFLKALKATVPRYANVVDNDLDYLMNDLPTDDEVDKAVQVMNESEISTANIPVECYIDTHDDLVKLWHDVKEYWKEFIDELNKEIEIEDSKWFNFFKNHSKFIQVSFDITYGRNNKDIEINDIYDKDSFKIIFTSPRNRTIFKDIQNAKDIECFVDFAIVPRFNHGSTLYKRYANKDHGFKLLPKEQQQPLDDTDTFPEDFNEVLNVGNEPWQNNIDYITRFHRSLEFVHVWDRHSCKVHSSIAGQSNHFFLGNSQVNFHPIKYFKLNSRDDKFWIELYNADNPTIPVRLTPHEGYVMELQFMQNDKLLYV